MSDDLTGAAADLAATPFDRARWDAALDGLARAGGGWASTLVVASPTRGYMLNVSPRMPTDVVVEAARFGLDPADQPRARMFDAPLMQVRWDSDVVSDAERAKSSYYALMRRLEVPYACMARVDQIEDRSVVIIAHRPETAGDRDAAAIERFSVLLPHLRSAMRLQLRLEDHGARLALGLMEAIGQAAVVCDRTGRIVAATPTADAALTAGGYVTGLQGCLSCPDAASDAALVAAIARASGPVALAQPTAGQVRLYDADRRGWITAHVASVPPEFATFRVNAAVLVLLNLATSAEAPVARLMRLYRFSAAEAEVALAIAGGATVRAVAERRGVAVSTLRTQVAAILAKTATTRQAELVALVLRAIR